QISLLNLDAGVELHFHGRSLALAVHGQANLVFARQREWAIGALLVFEQVVSGYAAGSLVTFVPDETVKPGFRLDLFLWFLVIGIPRVLQWFGPVAGRFANYCAGGIEHLGAGFIVPRIVCGLLDHSASRRGEPGEHRLPPLCTWI